MNPLPNYISHDKTFFALILH